MPIQVINKSFFNLSPTTACRTDSYDMKGVVHTFQICTSQVTFIYISHYIIKIV